MASQSGYTEDEIKHVYELGRFFLENGYLKKGESIMLGLTTVSPGFSPAWLGLSYVYFVNRHIERALDAAREAYQVDPSSGEAMLYLVVCFLALEDFNGAGTFLGELREHLESREEEKPFVRRLYDSQLARFQLRRQNSLVNLKRRREAAERYSKGGQKPTYASSEEE